MQGVVETEVEQLAWGGGIVLLFRVAAAAALQLADHMKLISLTEGGEGGRGGEASMRTIAVALLRLYRRRDPVF